MSGFVELGGGGESSGAGTDHSDFFPRAVCGGFGDDPTLLPAFIDDRVFDTLNCHSRVMDAEDAGAFTGGGADSSGEFREVIGFVESVEGFPPESAIYEVVPLGDEIVDRAAAGHAADEGASVAEWCAAVHAASTLLAEFFVGEGEVEFIPIVDAIDWCDFAFYFAEIFNKACWFSHFIYYASGGVLSTT